MCVCLIVDDYNYRYVVPDDVSRCMPMVNVAHFAQNARHESSSSSSSAHFVPAPVLRIDVPSSSGTTVRKRPIARAVPERKSERASAKKAKFVMPPDVQSVTESSMEWTDESR